MPVALETCFGWVLAGEVSPTAGQHSHVTSNHVVVENGDDILRQFWEVEQQPLSGSCRAALQNQSFPYK